MDDLLENVPNLLVPALNHPLGALNCIGQAVVFKPSNNERLIQLQRYFLWKAALVKLQVRSYHNHRAGRIVHTLAQQVLSESTLFALNHIRQALQRPIVAAQNRPPTAPVVQQ